MVGHWHCLAARKCHKQRAAISCGTELLVRIAAGSLALPIRRAVVERCIDLQESRALDCIQDYVHNAWHSGTLIDDLALHGRSLARWQQAYKPE